MYRRMLKSAALFALLLGGSAALPQTADPAPMGAMKMRGDMDSMATRQSLMMAHQDAMAILGALERNPAMKRELAMAGPAKAEAMLRAAGATRSESIMVTPNPGPTGQALTITITIKYKDITITITIKI